MNETRPQPNPQEAEKKNSTEVIEQQPEHPEQVSREKDAQQLEASIDKIKNEIAVLEQSKDDANKRATEEFGQLKQLWKDKIITSTEEFAALSQKISASSELASQKVREKYTEYRLARIDFLSHSVKPDEARERVLSQHIPERIDELQDKDIQAGGSNARGVYEIENENLIIVKKSGGSYEYDGALPFVMQDVQSERVPRVMEVFQKGDATYKVMEKASGTQLDQLSAEQVADIPQEHYDQLIDDIRNLNDKGLQIDPSKTSNCFYNPDKGFIIIDLADHYSERPYTEKPNQIDVDVIRAAVVGGGQDQRVIEKIQKAIKKY